jgi:hypothetical protein
VIVKYIYIAIIFFLLVSVFFIPHPAAAPRIPGLLERIQQPLYDQNTVSTSGTSALNYFQVPLGGDSITVKSDPAGHAQYIGLSLSQLTLVTSAGEVAIVAPSPWVNMSGTISGDGTFSISGQGTVAGYPNILSEMSGTFQNNILDGDLTMGGDGNLPTGQSITYHISGTAQEETLPTNTEQSPQTSSGNVIQSQQTQNFNIPSWIKNNAKWWAAGEIGDSDMIKGLQYLISDGIMVIPPTTYSATGSQEIPTWVKDNAQWWAEGQIGDSDFIKGVQYLISNGIITVQPKQSSGPALFQISPTTVQINPGESSYTTISGNIQNYQRGDPVTITVTRPDYTSSQLTIYATETGDFTTPLEFDQNSMQGTYSVTINYGVQSLGTVLVNVGSVGSSENPVNTQQGTTVEQNLGAIGCAGGEEEQSHDFSWWNTQKNQFTISENNLTILKQPTSTACGPTAGAIDLLHWNATIAPGIVTGSSTDLIQRLMALMHYRNGWGTTNMTIAAGLSEYINSTGNGGKLIVSVYGSEYENGITNTNSGTVHLVHSDELNSTVLYNAMLQKSNVLVIINSPDGTRSHVMKLLAINDTADSEGYHKIAFIDTESGGIITEYIGNTSGVTYADHTWYIMNIVTVTPTGSK